MSGSYIYVLLGKINCFTNYKIDIVTNITCITASNSATCVAEPLFLFSFFTATCMVKNSYTREYHKNGGGRYTSPNTDIKLAEQN